MQENRSYEKTKTKPAVESNREQEEALGPS